MRRCHRGLVELLLDRLFLLRPRLLGATGRGFLALALGPNLVFVTADRGKTSLFRLFLFPLRLFPLRLFPRALSFSLCLLALCLGPLCLLDAPGLGGGGLLARLFGCLIDDGRWRIGWRGRAVATGAGGAAFVGSAAGASTREVGCAAAGAAAVSGVAGLLSAPPKVQAA